MAKRLKWVRGCPCRRIRYLMIRRGLRQTWGNEKIWGGSKKHLRGVEK